MQAYKQHNHECMNGVQLNTSLKKNKNISLQKFPYIKVTGCLRVCLTVCELLLYRRVSLPAKPIWFSLYEMPKICVIF